MARFELIDLQHQKGVFRFVRVDEVVYAEPYQMQIPQESKTQGDLIDDEIISEIIFQRAVQKERFDAGMLSIQSDRRDPYMLFYGSSNDLRLPTYSDGRYTTSRKVQESLGRPWRVRAAVEAVY